MRRLSLLFALVFGVAVLGVLAFNRFFGDPRDRCEAEGGWYDLSGRVCAQPIYVPDITGRAPGESREAASRRQAQELVELERRIAAGEAARDADAAAQRKVLQDGGQTP